MAQSHDTTPGVSDKCRGRRLLLVGWDGTDPHVLKMLLAAGRLPHLKSLVDSGAILELDVPRPKFPQAAWTSLATGKRPHEHGVLHAFRKAGTSSVLQPVTRHDRQCSALWNVLGRAGLNSHIVGWPVTHPAEAFPGICVSDCFAGGRGSTVGPSIAPPEAAEIFIQRSMASHEVEEFTLTQLLPSRVVGSRAFAEVEAPCREILAQTATLFRSIRWCLDTQRWNFAACVFPGVRRCHDLASRLQSVSPATSELCEGLVGGCYEHHDLLLGQLLSQVDEHTYMMVVSPTSTSPPVKSPTASLQSDFGETHSRVSSARGDSGLAVICGPGVSKQPAILRRSLLDFTPTILALLGVPYGKDMAGRPLADLFEGGLASEAIETWDPTSPNISSKSKVEAVALPAATTERTTETQHLSDLGYVDPLDVAAHQSALHCERATELNRAISLMDARSLPRAAKVLERLAKEFPDWLDCRSLLAETYYRSGRYGEARNEVGWLTSHGFESPHLYLLSTAIAIAERQYDLALDEASCARRGMALPHGLSALLGSIQLRKRSFCEAELAFQHGIETDGPSAALFDGLASVKLQQKQYEEAAVLALDALERDMQLATAHYHLAVALCFLNRPHEALQALTSWATLDPRAAAPYRWMARVHRTLLNDPQQANACLECARKVIRGRRSREQAQAEGTSVLTSAP